MAKRTYPQNPAILDTAKVLKDIYIKDLKPIWKRVYDLIMKPTRKRIVVNLSRIEKNTNDNDIIIVPGKLLGTGTLTKKITIAPLMISQTAIEKIETNGSKVVSIVDLAKKNPNGTKIKIIG